MEGRVDGLGVLLVRALGLPEGRIVFVDRLARAGPDAARGAERPRAPRLAPRWGADPRSRLDGDDAARVQDIVTAIVYASRSGAPADIFAQGDAAVWSIFAAAVSDVRVSLQLKNVPKLMSNADYLEHFNVPGILRAGGEPVAESLANTR